MDLVLVLASDMTSIWNQSLAPAWYIEPPLRAAVDRFPARGCCKMVDRLAFSNRAAIAPASATSSGAGLPPRRKH